LPAQYGIKAALFTDFGTLGLVDERIKRNPDGTLDTKIESGLPFRASSGASIFWKSPMGPLRFDFAYPFRKAWYDRTENFRFSTYTRF
jgi:outer membrane protein insertion porin family